MTYFIDKPNRNSHEHDRLIQSQEDVTCHSTYGGKCFYSEEKNGKREMVDSIYH